MVIMDRHEIVDRLAPCGLDCRRCAVFAEGAVKQLATSLQAELAGFEKIAAKLAGKDPVLAHYREFLEVLGRLTEGSCVGCRRGGATLPFCAARTCYREKQVDFCFECDEFPCKRNSFPANLEERWLAYNHRMKAIGVERFFEEQLAKPRY